ncbi:hypothetical protein J6590_000863 [Homalodisca vitripennis]|nr:hypothetical protein J6590_000863 [Homalodisca vitripennis]
MNVDRKDKKHSPVEIFLFFPNQGNSTKPWGIKAYRWFRTGHCVSEVTMRWSLLVISAATLILSNSMASTIRSDSILNYGTTSSASKLSCSTLDTLTTCLKMKSLAFLENLVENDNPIPLFGGTVAVVRSFDVGEQPMTRISDEELSPNLPKDKKLKEATLDKLISSYAAKFVQTRSLQIRLPSMSSWNFSSSLDEDLIRATVPPGDCLLAGLSSHRRRYYLCGASSPSTGKPCTKLLARFCH